METTLVTLKIHMQKVVTLLITEEEFMYRVLCVQDMLYAKNILESLELKI